MSNLGTFLLYGLTCLFTYVAFSHVPSANVLMTKIVPVVGVLINFGLMGADLYFAFAGSTTTPATKHDTLIAVVVSAIFIVGSFAYLAIRSIALKQPMFLPPDHKEATA
jgi:hypothetical protein